MQRLPANSHELFRPTTWKQFSNVFFFKFTQRKKVWVYIVEYLMLCLGQNIFSNWGLKTRVVCTLYNRGCWVYVRVGEAHSALLFLPTSNSPHQSPPFSLYPPSTPSPPTLLPPLPSPLPIVPPSILPPPIMSNPSRPRSFSLPSLHLPLIPVLFHL